MSARALSLAISFVIILPAAVFGQATVTLDTPRAFPAIDTRERWETRAQKIREQVLISAGLWPPPDKQPINAHVFGRIERDGYSIEKVYFQTYPGFYLAGNLYRPTGHGKGPFPAILNPHGHWSDGRLADTKDGSIAARCISFARQGWIAFSYDMVGFNDTFFPDQPQVTVDKYYNRHRDFATNDVDQLWNINLLGLQTWDSVRALDFLASLPDVDQKRLACTGESGGGTQTYILGAIDDRLAAQVPVVMVSHTMQGGCSCENAPGLRVKYSNMEIAAAAVPRPQMLVAATGDWTRATLTVEGPAIQKIYHLFNADDAFHYVRFDYNHNYNQTSREAVYGWLGHRFLPSLDADALNEKPYQKEPDAVLRVFPDGKLPPDAISRDELIRQLKQSCTQRIERLWSAEGGSLKKFKATMTPAWHHNLQLDWPAANESVQKDSQASVGDLKCTKFKIPSQSGKVLEAILWETPKLKEARKRQVAILASMRPSRNEADGPSDSARKWLAAGFGVFEIDCSKESGAADQFKNFYTTYNKTTLQRRVADLVSLCNAARAREQNNSPRVVLCGEGIAGLYAMLAAPAADVVIADCGELPSDDEQSWLARVYFCPGMLAMGGPQTPLILASPNPLLLHNIRQNFGTSSIQRAYSGRHGSRLRHESSLLVTDDIIHWASAMK